LDGLLVIGPTGRVTCPQLKARHVNVAGAMRGDIVAEKVEIRAGGRVWGDVTTVAMSTEEGAFLRGQIQMEEKVHLGITRPVIEAAQVDNGSAAQQVAIESEAQAEGKDEASITSRTTASAESKKFKRKVKGKAKS